MEGYSLMWRDKRDHTGVHLKINGMERLLAILDVETMTALKL
jgi:hypothetical protein